MAVKHSEHLFNQWICISIYLSGQLLNTSERRNNTPQNTELECRHEAAMMSSVDLCVFPLVISDEALRKVRSGKREKTRPGKGARDEYSDVVSSLIGQRPQLIPCSSS